MLKILGAFTTLAACSTIGFTWAGVYEKRPRQLNALEAALQMLETEIIYGANPLPDAMAEIGQKCDPEVAPLFLNTAAELSKLEGITAGEAWCRAAGEFYPNAAFTRRDMHVINTFGVSLGASDREDQMKHLNLVKSQLKQAALEAEKASAKNAAVYKYLGFLGGLLLVLILY